MRDANAARALPQSAANATAATLLTRGVDSFNRWRRDAVTLLDDAIAADPHCCLAHALKGLALVGGRNRRFLPAIRDCAVAATRALGQRRVSDRERRYVDALRALLAGDAHRAVLILETLLVEYPHDLLAHRLIQQELFWLGEAAWMRDVSARARRHWSPQLADYAGLLSVYAFAHEEAGELDEAERAGRESVERDPSECWGAHAVAHVLEMRHRVEEGVDWLERLSGHWQQPNQIGHHLYWHLCLFYLELNDIERIYRLLDEQVYNPESALIRAVPDAYIDLQNVASLLLRLELRGVEVGVERWRTLSDAAAARIGNHASPFTSAHAAMVLAALGRFEDADELLRTLRADARGDDSLAPRIASAALPAAAAAIAHRRGDYQTAFDTLMPARHELWRIGGSHAQRDIFLQLLTDACIRLGRRDALRILLAEQRRRGFARVDRRSFYRRAAVELAA